MKLDRILRKPRSKEYMEAMQQLDAGGHVHNQQKVDALMDVIRQEFPEVELAGVLLGCVSICYLGAPYEVHTIDMKGSILAHYKKGQTLPDGQYNYGVTVSNGEGCEIDELEGAFWYWEVAKHGNSKMMMNLGIAYRNGNRGKEDGDRNGKAIRCQGSTTGQGNIRRVCL